MCMLIQQLLQVYQITTKGELVLSSVSQLRKLCFLSLGHKFQMLYHQFDLHDPQNGKFVHTTKPSGVLSPIKDGIR